MEYRRKGDTIVARLDRGEELVEKLRELAALENIRFATVIGHGQSNSAELYTFNDRRPGILSRKKPGPVAEYAEMWHLPEKEDYVMASITGFVLGPDTVDLTVTISTPCASEYEFLDSPQKNSGRCWAGHVKSAKVSTSCTIVLELIDLDAHLTRPDELGYDVLEFDS